MALDVSTIKQNHRAMWAAGDYPSVSRRIASVADGTMHVEAEYLMTVARLPA